jgi:hypothetical protein
MQIVEIKTYKFDELSEKAQMKAIEREQVNDYGLLYGAWYGDVINEWKEKLAMFGYEDTTIYFSGFSSQGDGACFITKNIDLTKWLKAQKLTNKYRASFLHSDDFHVSIEKISHHYSHEFTVDCNVEGWSDNEKINEQLNMLEKIIIDHARSLMKQIYRDLEAEYDYLTDEDVIRDYLTSNEFDFLEDGTIA